jgi:hypothetical protein
LADTAVNVPRGSVSPQGVLPKITIRLSKFSFPRNSFDCVAARAVRSLALGPGIIAMLDAVTALFGIISAGIFLAHAVDGYWSR